MKKIIAAVPLLGPMAKRLYKSLKHLTQGFPGSEAYWEQRYQRGGNSGAGSYDKLAHFKAEVLNDFVTQHAIDKVIEYGCGDGNQLALSAYPSYLGFDVSEKAIAICRRRFHNDKSKQFKLLSEHESETAALTISLDVIYHLIEDQVFSNYLSVLFDSSTKFVIVYSSNSDGIQYAKAPHVKHREFTNWINNNCPKWTLIQHVKNKYPYIENDYSNGSFADFYIFSRVDNDQAPE